MEISFYKENIQFNDVDRHLDECLIILKFGHTHKKDKEFSIIQFVETMNCFFVIIFFLKH